MGNENLINKYQKFLPYILIIVTLLLGGFLMVRKGIIPIPSFVNKTKVIDISKSSMIDILFSGDEYKLSSVEMPGENLVTIAKFDKKEQWQGEGSIESGLLAKDENVLSLIDRDRQRAVSYILKKLDLSKFDTIKLYVNLKTDPDDLESVNIILGNEDLTSFYRFPVTNLEEKYNFLAIPKYRFFLVEGQQTNETDKSTTSSAVANSGISWDKIERVQLELISRPQSKASADVGWIRAEKEGIFTPDWNWSGSEHFFNLDSTPDGKTALLIQNIDGSVGTLRKVGSVKDFSYSARITTIKKGAIGLFFRGNYKTGYGYYLAVGGLGTSTWFISKYSPVETKPTTTELLGGQIGNFEFSKDQPFWLKTEVNGNNIAGYFSLDGKDYTKLGEVNDNEFDAGGVGVGLADNGAGYFDDFSLAKK